MRFDIKSYKPKGLIERWPSQFAQIDCRVETCDFYNGSGECTNPSPAITLNPNKTFTCWNEKKKLML